MDKAFWQDILEANGALPADHDLHTLTDELLIYLGSPDAHLRDGVAYPLLAQWISEGRYSRDDLRAMAMQLTANLQVGLGEEGTESVFLRAFSALMLAELIHQENKRSSFEFEEADVRAILEVALAYLPAERDLRGYVPGFGWAHAVAHASDLLWVLAGSRYLGAPDLERVLDAIASKVAPPGEHVYLFNEDTRMARAVMGVLRRDLVPLSFLSAWLERLARPEGRAISIEEFFVGEPPAIASQVNVCLLHNTRQFLRSLYFALAAEEQPPAVAADFTPQLLEALKPMHEA
jgi:hypothetical protein